MPQLRVLSLKRDVGPFDHASSIAFTKTLTKLVKSQSTPWPHLSQIYSDGAPTFIVLPLLCLPTMRSAEVRGMWYEEINRFLAEGWPAELPKSYLRTLFFSDQADFGKGFIIDRSFSRNYLVPESFAKDASIRRLFKVIADHMKEPCTFEYEGRERKAIVRLNSHLYPGLAKEVPDHVNRGTDD